MCAALEREKIKKSGITLGVHVGKGRGGRSGPYQLTQGDPPTEKTMLFATSGNRGGREGREYPTRKIGKHGQKRKTGWKREKRVGVHRALGV